MSEYTEGFRCKEALDQDRAIIQEQSAEFLKAGGNVTELVQDNSKAKADLAKKFRPLLSKSNNFKNIGLGEL